MLAATQAYNLKLERDRVHRHLAAMPNALQRFAAQNHLGDLDRGVHRLAQTAQPGVDGGIYVPRPRLRVSLSQRLDQQAHAALCPPWDGP